MTEAGWLHKKMYDLVIIGGGPAGVTAGIYAVRKNLKVLMITKDFTGQAGKASVIENWPGIKKISGLELMDQFREHANHLGLEVIEEEVASKIDKKGNEFKIKTDKGNEFDTKSVIIASGRNLRPLKVKGEEKYIGKGVSYCAVCDAPLFSRKKVAIIGGGNSGFETAIEMAGRNAPKIYILEMTPRVVADEALQKEVEEMENIELFTRAILKEIRGDNFVRSIIYEDKKSGEERELEVEGVFVEIGSIPVTDFLKNLADCNNKGEIMIDHKSCATKTPGLFAAGDVTDIPYKQIVIAAGEGSKAALAVYDYLRKLKQ